MLREQQFNEWFAKEGWVEAQRHPTSQAWEAALATLLPALEQQGQQIEQQASDLAKSAVALAELTTMVEQLQQQIASRRKWRDGT